MRILINLCFYSSSVSLKDQEQSKHNMDTFRKYILRQTYRELSRLGDRLAKIDKQIDWERFRPIIKAMYRNDTPQGGRPNTDEVVMVKLLVLQQWIGLSDPELERQRRHPKAVLSDHGSQFRE